MNLQKVNRNRGLDGVRAMAVLLVLIIHSEWNVPLVKTGGAAGVDIFFVLSGYLITRILRKELLVSQKANWLRFCLNRLIRLWPALLTVVVFALAPGLLVYSTKILFLQNALFGVTFSYILFSGLLNGQELAFGHLWTLSIEQSFYLVFPLFLGLTYRAKFNGSKLVWIFSLAGFAMLMGTTVAGALAPHADGPGGFWGYARAGGLLFGAALAIALENQVKLPTRVFEYLGLALIITSLAVSGMEQLVGLSFMIADFGSLSLVYAFTTSQRLGFVGRVFANKYLAYVGLISYEIYLWHFPLLNIGATASNQSLQTASWWAYPLAFALASLTHHFWSPAQSIFRKKLNSRFRE